MIQSEPDFLSRVETNRFQPSPSNEARLLEKKKAYWNQIIQLQLVLPHNSTTSQLEKEQHSNRNTDLLKIPRFRLTQQFMQDAVNRASANEVGMPLPSSPTSKISSPAHKPKAVQSSAAFTVSHLHHRESNTVILPQDMQSQCQTSIVYDVIIRSAGEVKLGGVLSEDTSLRRNSVQKQSAICVSYQGGVLFVVNNIPITSVKENHLVTQDDVYRWIVNGAISDEETITLPTNKVENIKETLHQLEKEIKNLPTAKLYNEQGRAIVGDAKEAARESKFNFLTEERKRLNLRLEKAEQSLGQAVESHFKKCQLLITPRPQKVQGTRQPNAEENGSSWNIVVTGRKKEYYTDLISRKKNWRTTPLYATGCKDTKGKQTPKKTSPILNSTVTDKAEHLVDTGYVRIEKVPEGFGVLETYHESNAFNSDNDMAFGDESEQIQCEHYLYHGSFKDGSLSGSGTEYTEQGIYKGVFSMNEPSGHGTMKYNDGIVITGDFSLSTTREDASCIDNNGENESSLGSNRYQRGLPHGLVHIDFPDGATYDGEMQHGKITGKGVYKQGAKSKMSKKKKSNVNHFEIEGNFFNGRHVDEIENQANSNLLKSFMFEDQRLWIS